MSTKATIAHGDTFHFYHEALDDDHVYLELNTTQFEAGYGRVMIPIPIHIWEVIRHLGGARLDLVEKALIVVSAWERTRLACASASAREPRALPGEVAETTIKAVEKTDEGLLAMVEGDVDARIAEYQKAMRTHPDRAGWASLAGSLVYGGAEEPREQQIARGMEYYRGERQRQREVRAAIEKLRAAQRQGSSRDQDENV